MKFLLYLMDGGLNSFQGEMDCERLKYPQVDFLSFMMVIRRNLPKPNLKKLVILEILVTVVIIWINQFSLLHNYAVHVL